MRIAREPLILRASIALVFVTAVVAFAPSAPTAQLRVYRLDEEGARPLLSGQRARAGDVVQAAFSVPAGERAWVYSRDGRGEVTLHAAAAKGGRWRMTTRAFALDDAPGCEDFVLFVADDAEGLRGRLSSTKCGDEVDGAVVFALRKD